MRSYRPDPIPKELLNRVLEAVRIAPSGRNRQPWKFTIVQDEALKRAKITANQAIYIGDSPRDFMGAKGVGMITMLIGEEAGNETTSVPDYVVTTLKEAYELVVSTLS